MTRIDHAARLAPLVFVVGCSVNASWPGGSTTSAPGPRPVAAAAASPAAQPDGAPSVPPAPDPEVYKAQYGGAADGPARRTSGAVLHPGAALSDEETDCSAARNHCLRPETWLIASGFDDTRFREGRVYHLIGAFEFEGAWWRWTNQGEPLEGVAFRTAPATLADLRVGEPVVWYSHPHGRQPVPAHEDDANDQRYWNIGVVTAIEAGQVKLGYSTIDLASARVVVERR